MDKIPKREIITFYEFITNQNKSMCYINIVQLEYLLFKYDLCTRYIRLWKCQEICFEVDEERSHYITNWYYTDIQISSYALTY